MSKTRHIVSMRWISTVVVFSTQAIVFATGGMKRGLFLTKFTEVLSMT